MARLRIHRRILGAVIVGLALSWAGPGHAAEFADLLADIAGGSFGAKIKAVEEIAATGDARAAAILEAFVDGDLYTRTADGKVVIGKAKGNVLVLTDPLTGEETGDAKTADLDKIRVNNRLRGIIRGALGNLTLLNADPAVRGQAADALFKSRSADSLAALEKALERETDAGVRGKMELARAAIFATTAGDVDVQVDAVIALSQFARPDVANLLRGLQNSAQDEKLSAAVVAALETVDEKLALWRTVGDLFRGLSLGSVLLLAAVGLAITFGVMGVINMAHGELVMLGAYTTFVVQEVIRTHAPGLFDYSIFIAIPLAFCVSGLFGIAIERGIIRYLYGRPLETLLATWGLSLILQQLVRTIFGPTNQEVGSPSWMSGAVELTGGLVLTYNRIWIIVFSLIVLGLLALVLRKTPLGLQMRAVTQNRTMAASMGIRTGWIDALTFGLGSGIAGVAGVAISQIDNVSPNLGQAYIIDSFLVVVFGGVGNLWGTFMGAFGLGIVNKFLEPFSGAVLGKILVLVAIILFIQVRPRGMFALKGRAVEA
jgi:urea transport system permease protein